VTRIEQRTSNKVVHSYAFFIKGMREKEEFGGFEQLRGAESSRGVVTLI
jgi:hypothetical protein